MCCMYNFEAERSLSGKPDCRGGKNNRAPLSIVGNLGWGPFCNSDFAVDLTWCYHSPFHKDS